VTLAKFVAGLKPFIADDERQKHNIYAFRILDIDQDNQLNIINLLHLFKNLPQNSRLGKEIYAVIDYFLEKNLYTKSILGKV
jgi:Ca2+-binding EF-hand superfamily protein